MLSACPGRCLNGGQEVHCHDWRGNPLVADQCGWEAQRTRPKWAGALPPR